MKQFSQILRLASRLPLVVIRVEDSGGTDSQPYRITFYFERGKAETHWQETCLFADWRALLSWVKNSARKGGRCATLHRIRFQMDARHSAEVWQSTVRGELQKKGIQLVLPNLT